MDPRAFAAVPLIDRQLNRSEAAAYLDAVKAHFPDQPDVYKRFLEVMSQFKAGRLVACFSAIIRVN